MSFPAESVRPTDLLDPVREVLQDDEIAQEYLTTRWIGRAMLALRRARRQSGLSQKDVAERMATKQPSIARLEGDETGGVSLRRYAEYLAACGVTPFDIETVDSEQLRNFLLGDVGSAALATRFKQWLALSLSENLEAEVASASSSHQGPKRGREQANPIDIIPFPTLQGAPRVSSEESFAEACQTPVSSSSTPSRSRQQFDSSALVAA